MTCNIVGVGSVLMGDDGVGPAAVEALARCNPGPGVALHDAGLAVSDVLGTLCPSDPLIIVDAIRAGGPPGSIYRVRPEDGILGGEGLRGCVSLHQLSVLPALQSEAVTGRVFQDVTIFGVEPGVIEWGEGLSPAVVASIPPLVETVLAHVAAARDLTVSATLRDLTGDLLL